MERERERDTYGCLQSVGHWTVSAYLQVDSSVIELIIALVSAHTNLTCKWKQEKIEHKWDGKENLKPLDFQLLHTSVSRGWLVRSHMVPFVYWWAWYLHEPFNTIISIISSSSFSFLGQGTFLIKNKFSLEPNLSIIILIKSYLWDASFEWGSFNSEISDRFWLKAAVASASYWPKTNSWTSCNEIKTYLISTWF